jgi:alpha-amylase
MVEFLAETNSHSLVSLRSRSEFERQVNNHKEMLKEFLGVEPTSFRNTELIYSDTDWIVGS